MTQTTVVTPPAGGNTPPASGTPRPTASPTASPTFVGANVAGKWGASAEGGVLAGLVMAVLGML